MNEKSSKAELGILSSVTSAAELVYTVEALQMRKEDLQDRLTQLRGLEVKPVSETEKAAVEHAHKIWQKHASDRTRIVKELWYKCVDVLEEGTTKEDLWEELGCEGQRPS